jgi:hypothetical protein
MRFIAVLLSKGRQLVYGELGEVRTEDIFLEISSTQMFLKARGQMRS